MPGLPNTRPCPWIFVRSLDWSIHCKRCHDAKVFDKDPTVRQFEMGAKRFIRKHKKCLPQVQPEASTQPPQSTAQPHRDNGSGPPSQDRSAIVIEPSLELMEAADKAGR